MTVDAKFAGLIIGRGGATIKAISKEAGSGCKIKHDNNNKGTFKISAWNRSSILLIKNKMNDIIKKAMKINDKKQNSPNTTTYKNTTLSTYYHKSHCDIIDSSKPIGPVSVEMNKTIEKVTGYKWLPGINWGDEHYET